MKPRTPRSTPYPTLLPYTTHFRSKSIPIVMLSSEDSTTERIKLLEEGAADYILKPFNPLELKVRIKKIID